MSQDSGTSNRNQRQKFWSILTCLLVLASPCKGFFPDFWTNFLTLSLNSYTHQYITEQAIRNITLEILRETTKQNGAHGEKEIRLDCAFWRAVRDVVISNSEMDSKRATKFDPVYHFDSEQVDSSITMLQEFWNRIVLSIQAEQYDSARHALGQLFHSIQDFYSHSNWVEMGKRSVYLHLLQPDEPAFPVANEDTPTCQDCFTATCRNNLLPALTNTQRNATLLTTGYTSGFPLKPKGKCSHGGILDSSRHQSAKGGINKDTPSLLFSPHHYLHVEAATLASEATMMVLRDLKDTVGLKAFLKLFSVKQVPALVFVMDTTGSMFEEITAAKLRAHSIIQSRADSTKQPGKFLLVPFHDPKFGPVFESDDPNQFMEHMETLVALGGGDEPEMCLSAIQLALTHSPPNSEIFVFTDASPKDSYLFDAVKALTLEKRSKITFLLTQDQRRRRRKRSSKIPLSPDRFSLYSTLSVLSGGMAVFTTNSDIHSVSTIVEDNTAVDKVTLLHVRSDPELMSVHSFRVDSSVENIILHITGTMAECILTSPADQSQSLLSENGHLAELEHFQGLYRIKLLPPVQAGQWNLKAKSKDHLTFKVIGDSSVDFLYYFATVTNDTHPGLARVEGSPLAGAPAFLVLAVTGRASPQEDSFHVTLIGAEGESLKQVKLNRSSSSPTHGLEELVGYVDSVPAVPFSVRLTGLDSTGNKLERVSTEKLQSTHVQIEMVLTPHLIPGHRTVVEFDIHNHGPAQLFNLTADDDCGYLLMRGPHRFFIKDQGSLRDQVSLLTPAAAQAGATVTLTLTVHALDSLDSNYAVTFLTVVPLNADRFPPSCSVTRLQSDCPADCSKSSWRVSLVVSDDVQSGLAALQMQKGDGVLTIFHNPPSTEESFRENHPDLDHQHHPGKGHHQHHHHYRARLQRGDPPLNVSEWEEGSLKLLWVMYTSSCCSTQAELLVWDKAGNMKRCVLTSGQKSVQSETTTETSGTGRTKPAVALLLLMCLQLDPLM
ncbi:PREDICTED: von Willebrand factor A domain-containing protein 7-like [Cyprinodon variegatus]|uniref:von Willebrand factor A domain-containing protein 7-like n=1 Tax=Cyprinodon variegatus TaxID=28743 RepID=UPI0007426992|nr:PREDICTED: von Willebrand factor A domain-containing protein 7-like [Cyprinodon variegatus]XP_015228238.1 PREDICTED: von Willebrand factor A domain-containing protein 7-like [Cyprinodon variegatus]XP_015228239.1 PREDICTED: von Willebrand factor A domain-containing protein 7-like [Cyprinodon variegatus]XP_015228240.1 PREDICTED: von Willebrand factor A domain-containing protein 7-like [Cyprinodon variegatus]XP_015228242.1 PREDICTED: von Willebrand factor A domain-containing protein 7-like [Cyp